MIAVENLRFTYAKATSETLHGIGFKVVPVMEWRVTGEDKCIMRGVSAVLD